MACMAEKVTLPCGTDQACAGYGTDNTLAPAQNESAVHEMGTGELASIARDLVRSLRRDVTTDWVSRDDVRAKLRTTIKRLLAKHGYPPEAEPGAIRLVLTQMETFAEDWAPEAA